nr:hypothetical protein [Mycoplasmopsis citelli]
MSNIFNKIGVELIIRLLFGDQAFENGVFKVHYIYILMGILAGITLVLVLMISLIKTLFDSKKGNEKQISIYKKIIPVIISIFVFPALTFILLLILFNVQSLLYIVFFGPNAATNFDLGRSVFLSLKPAELDHSYWESVANDNYFAYGLIYNLNSYAITMVVLAVIGITILLQLLVLSISLVTHLLSTVALFFLNPVVSVSRFYDEDKLYNKWKDMYYKKLSIIFSYNFALNMFILVIGFLNNIDFGASSFLTLGIIKLILIGGALGGVQVLIGDISELFGNRESVKSGFRVARDIANGAKRTAFAVAGGIGLAKGATQRFGQLAKGVKNSTVGTDLQKSFLKSELKKGNISKLQYNKQLAEHKNNIKSQKAEDPNYNHRVRTGVGGWIEDTSRSITAKAQTLFAKRADTQYQKGKISKEDRDRRISESVDVIDRAKARDKHKYNLIKGYNQKQNYSEKNHLNNKGNKK